MHRNLTVTLSSLAGVSFLILILSAMVPPPRQIQESSPKVEPSEALKAMNLRNSRAETVYCPKIRMGLVSISSLFYERDGETLFSTWFLGMREAVVGFDNEEYWFWIRSFDRKSLYFCDRSRMESTRIRTIMMPEVMAIMAWVPEADFENGAVPYHGGFKTERKMGKVLLSVEFDHEKVLSQQISEEGRMIATLEGSDFKSFSGIMLPRKIKATWHEEDLSSEFLVEEWIINKKNPGASLPEGLERVSLEGCFSSSKKSVSFSFSPIPPGQSAEAKPTDR